jgi:hypothetical protein
MPESPKRSQVVQGRHLNIGLRDARFDPEAALRASRTDRQIVLLSSRRSSEGGGAREPRLGDTQRPGGAKAAA